MDGGTEQPIANEIKQSAPAIRVTMERLVWLESGAPEKFIVADYSEKLGGKKVIYRHLTFCRRTLPAQQTMTVLGAAVICMQAARRPVYAA
ncbi:MAG TPA: hypothetical protein VGW77_34650 [Candidatus Binatia bacterium]|nr:hypothetical protein [Candidatus Binatia bacterium]